MRLFLVIPAVLTLSACEGVKYNQVDSFHKDFSPQLKAYGETIPAQWKDRDWDPTQWPLSYQNKDKFTQGLFDADILREQYIKADAVPVVVVGPGFYRLSDLDQGRVCKTLDMLYGATNGPYGHFLLQDWYSRDIVGDYTKTGLTLR
jgi:hypothetical protein